MKKWEFVAPALFLVAFAAGVTVIVLNERAEEIDNASTEATHPYVEEYTQCTQQRGPLECKAALTEAARENEGEALARQVADDIDEYRHAEEKPTETAGEPHAE